MLKGLAVTYVMAPREQEPLLRRASARSSPTSSGSSPTARPLALEPPFAADWAAAADDAARLRVVVDQVASLTDVSAAEWHAPALPSAAPPRAGR